MDLGDLVDAARLLPQVPMYGVFRAADWPTLKPLAMSFVVTDRCNSRCKTCNIGRRYLADPRVADDDLTYEEYARVFRTVGRPRWVTLSGGEPFMRKDFADIVLELLRTVSPWVINVPTNGWFTAATASSLERIVPELRDRRIVLNFSVDGVGAVHDEVRGLPNGFARMLDTVDRVRELGDPRLTIGVNTVISRFNAHLVEQVLDFVRERIRPDSHVVEAAQVRPEYYNEGEALAARAAEVDRALASVVDRLQSDRHTGVPRLIKAFRLEYYADVRRSLVQPRGHRCFSGFASCTMTPKGEVWSNSQRADSMGNIREHGYDFDALWRSARAKETRERIRRDSCRCELSNATYTNTLLNPRGMGRVARNFVRYP